MTINKAGYPSTKFNWQSARSLLHFFFTYSSVSSKILLIKGVGRDDKFKPIVIK